MSETLDEHQAESERLTKKFLYDREPLTENEIANLLHIAGDFEAEMLRLRTLNDELYKGIAEYDREATAGFMQVFRAQTGEEIPPADFRELRQTIQRQAIRITQLENALWRNKQFKEPGMDLCPHKAPADSCSICNGPEKQPTWDYVHSLEAEIKKLKDYVKRLQDAQHEAQGFYYCEKHAHEQTVPCPDGTKELK